MPDPDPDGSVGAGSDPDGPYVPEPPTPQGPLIATPPAFGEVDDVVPAVGPKRGIGVIAYLAIGWILLVSLGAILAPVLPIASTTETSAELAEQPPSFAHPFGGDRNGKDVLALTVHGGRVSLFVGFVAVGVGLLVGGVMGIMSGYLRGTIDTVFSILFDTFLAVPAIILALALVAAFDPADPSSVDPTRRMFVLALALGLVSIPVLGRIARASTLSVADREFVLAAKAMGAKPLRIMLREVLPNVVPSMLVIGLLGMGVAIVAEGGLALLGGSVSSPATSWGAIIAANKSQLSSPNPWVVFGPSLFIFLTVLALNFLGDVIRRRLDVRDSVL